MTKIVLSLLAIILFICNCSDKTPSAGDRFVEVKVTVIDTATEHPLAEVQASVSLSEQEVFQRVTDESGQFSFSFIGAPRSVGLELSKEGYVAKDTTVFCSEEVNQVEIELSPN